MCRPRTLYFLDNINFALASEKIAPKGRGLLQNSRSPDSVNGISLSFGECEYSSPLSSSLPCRSQEVESGKVLNTENQTHLSGEGVKRSWDFHISAKTLSDSQSLTVICV